MSFLYSLFSPTHVLALENRSIVLETGIRIAWPQLVANLTGFVAASAFGVCTLVFLIGASLLVISAGDQTKVDNGKKMMVGALIGLAIIMGSYGILRTILYFLYEGA